jgi:hypothetical protein
MDYIVNNWSLLTDIKGYIQKYFPKGLRPQDILALTKNMSDISQIRGQKLLYYTPEDSLLKDFNHNKRMILHVCTSIFSTHVKTRVLKQIALPCSHLLIL